MAPHGRPRPRPEPSSPPTSLTEITRRYAATALALSKALGVSYSEAFIREHRESITSCFIQAGMEGIRLPSSVQLPALAPGAQASPEPEPGPLLAGEASPNGTGSAMVSRLDADDVPDFSPPPDPAPVPLIIPPGLPCAGKSIASLPPAQLRMLLSKVDALSAQEGSAWQPLLEALASERQARLQAGRRPKPVVVEGVDHGT